MRDLSDRGSVDLALTLPLVLLLILGAVQLGVYVHAHHTAETITTHALTAARTHTGTTEAGEARAEEVTDQLAGTLLTQTAVSVERGPTTTRVTLTAAVPTLLPGADLPIAHELTAPTEHLTPPTP